MIYEGLLKKPDKPKQVFQRCMWASCLEKPDDFFLWLHKCLSKNTFIPLRAVVAVASHIVSAFRKHLKLTKAKANSKFTYVAKPSFLLFGSRHFPLLRASNIKSSYNGPKHTGGIKQSMHLFFASGCSVSCIKSPKNIFFAYFSMQKVSQVGVTYTLSQLYSSKCRFWRWWTRNLLKLSGVSYLWWKFLCLCGVHMLLPFSTYNSKNKPLFIMVML